MQNRIHFLALKRYTLILAAEKDIQTREGRDSQKYRYG